MDVRSCPLPSRTTTPAAPQQQQQQQTRTVRHHCPPSDNHGSPSSRGLSCRGIRPEHPQSESLPQLVDPLTHRPAGAAASASPVSCMLITLHPNCSSPADLSYSPMARATLPASPRPNSFKNSLPISPARHPYVDYLLATSPGVC